MPPEGGDVEMTDESEEPELDMEIVNALMQMGAPENVAKHSVFNAPEPTIDSASETFFMNIENPDF